MEQEGRRSGGLLHGEATQGRGGEEQPLPRRQTKPIAAGRGRRGGVKVYYFHAHP